MRRTTATGGARRTPRASSSSAEIEQKINRRDVRGQGRGQARSEDAAKSRAGGDKAEEPLALLGVEHIDHQRPKNRNDE